MIKIFCNQCQKYIKDAELKEMSKLTGDEVCSDCTERNRETFADVEKAQKQAVSEINHLADKHKVTLDELIRKRLKGEE